MKMKKRIGPKTGPWELQSQHFLRLTTLNAALAVHISYVYSFVPSHDKRKHPTQSKAFNPKVLKPFQQQTVVNLVKSFIKIQE